jgi:heme/copper-type cytochrome/quinol oxidase subunit 2
VGWRNRLLLFVILAGPAAALAVAWRVESPSLELQVQGQTERPFPVTAHKYAFDPPRIEVFEGDLVKIEFRALDIAHSFTIDDYRISKRAAPGEPITFEFRAERRGTFLISCNLQIDEGCRRMRGELVVKPRK